MAIAGRGEQLTAEDRAAKILAAALGPGSCWTAEYEHTNPRRRLQQPDDNDGEEAPDAIGYLHVAKSTETMELAGQALHWNEKKWPAWVKRLPAEQRAKALTWSMSHSLKSKGAYRVREFEHWKTWPTWAVIPETPDGSEVAAALAIADLQGPLRPLLMLWALQDAQQIETVLRYAIACRLHKQAAIDALNRLLWPSHGVRKPSLTANAKKCGIRYADYLRMVDAAHTRFADWLHRACVGFLRAYEKWGVPAGIACTRATDENDPVIQSPTVVGNVTHPRFGVMDRGTLRPAPPLASRAA